MVAHRASYRCVAGQITVPVPFPHPAWPLWTLRELAAETGHAESAIRKWTAKGRLSGHDIGAGTGARYAAALYDDVLAALTKPDG